MRARSISTIAVAFVTLAVVFLVGTLTTEAAGQKKGGKGKPTEVLGRAVFRDLDPENISPPAPAHIKSDGAGTEGQIREYIDERAEGGGNGVEETLGGTKGLGHFTLRLEGSDPARTVTLDFSNPVLDSNLKHLGCLLDDESAIDPYFLELGKSGFESVTVSIRELTVNPVGFLKDKEADLNIDYECAALDCIAPGERRAARLYLNWVSLDVKNLPNTRVAVAFRNNLSINNRLAPDYVMVTRCGGDLPETDSPPPECSGIDTADFPGPNDDHPNRIKINPKTTWIISTRSVSPDRLPTGPQACVRGHSIKGKSIHTNYGLFYMPLDLVISCVSETDCSGSGA